MDFSALLERYTAIHFRGLTDDCIKHLRAFAAHCDGAAMDLAERAESAAAAAMTAVAETIAPPAPPVVDDVVSEAVPEAPAPEADPADDQPAAA